MYIGYSLKNGFFIEQSESNCGIIAKQRKLTNGEKNKIYKVKVLSYCQFPQSLYPLVSALCVNFVLTFPFWVRRATRLSLKEEINQNKLVCESMRKALQLIKENLKKMTTLNIP